MSVSISVVDIKPNNCFSLFDSALRSELQELLTSFYFDPESGSQKATLVVLVVVVISSLKIPKAFLIRSGVQRNFAYAFVLTLPTDLQSQIFHLFPN